RPDPQVLFAYASAGTRAKRVRLENHLVMQVGIAAMTHAKRKFVLVDQSIRGLGGHHYEYAVRVLAAARDDGFDARLVTNKHLSRSVNPDFPVLPIFEFGYWDRPLRVGPLVFRSFPPPGWIGAVRRSAYAVSVAIVQGAQVLKRWTGAGHGATKRPPLEF